MAMEIGSTYGAHTEGYVGRTGSERKAAGSRSAGRAENAARPKLSEKAQKLLEKLRKTYGNMDFMAADFEDGEEAKEILSRGTKEFSVLFSCDELEKMASDEKYEQEYMSRVESAVRMSSQINQQFGFESAFGKDGNGGEVTRVGISFNQDGSTTFFAELEKSSEKQRERIEKAGEEKRAEKREKAEKEERVKSATVWADSLEELLEKVRKVDWSAVDPKDPNESGKKVDFSV